MGIKSLPIAKIHSLDETTFARRLTRSCLETGLQLLNNADIRPAALNYVFKLSLPYLTPDQIRARFKIMLSRNQYEDLDWWDTPFISLGGAGTHYPRRDARGNIIRQRNGWTVKEGGSTNKGTTRLQSLENGQYQDLEGVDLTGFEGEWFDAHDVEGYLEEKFTCKIDPKSSFAECYVEAAEDDDMMSQLSRDRLSMPYLKGYQAPSLTNSSSVESADSHTPPANTFDSIPEPPNFTLNIHTAVEPITAYPGDLPKIMNYDISFDQTLGLDLAPSYNYDFGHINNMNNMNMRLDMMSDSFETIPVTREKRKKQVWVDVSRLIDLIIKHGVCLGRSPGFRRKDVDMAVLKAVVDTGT